MRNACFAEVGRSSWDFANNGSWRHSHGHSHGHKRSSAPRQRCVSSDGHTSTTDATESCHACGRRSALAGLSIGAAWVATSKALAVQPGMLLNERPPASSPAAAAAASACYQRMLSGTLAASLAGALYMSLMELRVAEEAGLYREIFKLRDREYPYYYKSNSERLPRIPDLSDLSGGMSNPTYFNFNYYILWKVAARRVHTAQQRTELCAVYGQQLLPRVWEGAAEAAARAARAGPSGRATQAATLALVTQLMDTLLDGGYMCDYQVVWGEAPGSWPGDWMVSQERVAGEPASDADDARGVVFQVKLHEPADIAGSVALRAEEDGFWSRSVSSMVTALLRQAGYADAIADEYFFQDEWSGPRDLPSRVLLMLGDPLEMVDVPFVPSTLVQNWTL